MTQLYFLEIEPLYDSAVMSEMMQFFLSEKKERLERYHNGIDKKLGVYAETLVRCMICLKLGVKYKELKLQVSRTGKPCLEEFLNYEFNISHTRNGIAAAVSDKPVGVDVERIRAVDISMADRIYSDNEMAWLNDPAADKHHRFLELWTKKEALVKYYGAGLPNDLKSYDVTLSLRNERLTSYVLDDYIVSICSGVEGGDTDFKKISERELVDMWRNLTV